MSRVILTETDLNFGGADLEFMSQIDTRFTQQAVFKLTGMRSAETIARPITKRDDELHYNNRRLDMVLGYYMGIFEWVLYDLEHSPLLGLHDHEGLLTSYWNGEIDIKHLNAIHNAWGCWYETFHYAVSYGGMGEHQSKAFTVEYETAS
jgi:hypothetical protein